jgi:hypothetical protein
VGADAGVGGRRGPGGKARVAVGYTGVTAPGTVLLRVKSFAGPTGQVADWAETPLT